MWSHPAMLAVVGFAVGLMGSLVGAGGGFFLVPFFISRLGFAHPLAVGTSLGVVVANASSGTIGYARQKRVDWLLGLILGLATLPGTYVGKVVALQIKATQFSVLFGAMTALAALLLVSFRAENRPGLAWFRSGLKRRLVDAKGETHEYGVNLPVAIVLSVAIGFTSSLFGVGGGWIHVPLMVLLFGVPMHVAVATSGFALLLTSAGGAAQYAVDSLVEPRVLLWAGLGAFLGAQFGARAADRLRPAALRLVLAAVLVGVGGWMIYSGVKA